MTQSSKLEMLSLSGQDMLSLFQAKKLSPTEVMQATIERCEEITNPVNPFTETYYDQALEQAKVATQRYMDGDARPMEGLPFAVKEEFKLAGTKRTSSSLVFKDRVDQETDVIIQRVLDQGAIAHVKTTTPEFCILGSTHSRLFGVTRNPWNLDHTPGGSSGGSGVALATGAATLASGTDIGGSIRIPASASGVVGYKAPYGRIPELPVYNLDYYSHSGPMARTVKDTAMLFNAMQGQHYSDIASLREEIQIDLNQAPNVKGWKIAYSEDFGIYTLEKSVRENLHKALDIFRSLGATVQEVDLGWDEDCIIKGETYLAHLAGSDVARLLDTDRDNLTDYAIDFAEASLRTTGIDFIEANEKACSMYASFGPMMENYDLFICPTLACAAPPADYCSVNNMISFDGEVKPTPPSFWEMTMLFNMLSRCPVLAVPSGISDYGVPTGIQIIGKAYHDEKVFEAGIAYEQIAQWPDYTELKF